MKIGFIGAGYVGLITATVLAYKNPNNKFYVIDALKSKIDALKQGKHYIKELGFRELFDKCFVTDDIENIQEDIYDDTQDIDSESEEKDELTIENIDKIINKSYNNLIVSTDYDLLKECDIIFIAVCTPDCDGKCNLTYFNDAIKKLDEFITKDTIIIVKSTVPIGTTKSIHFKSNAHVFNMPEFLAEGSAIQDLLNPVRILIGSASKNSSLDESENKAIEKIKSLFYYVDNSLIAVTDSNTSELIKLSSNFLLASRVAHINLLETIAEEYDANINDISKILRMDSRIGNKFLNPSIAFGGSCFRKDINNLSSICHDETFSKYIKSVNHINEHHVSLLVELLRNILKTDSNFNSKNQHKILILGYGFKNNTEDIRESPTKMFIDLIENEFEYECYDTHIDKYSKFVDVNEFDIFILMNDEAQYVQVINSIIEERFNEEEQSDILINNNKLAIKNNKCIILNPKHTKLL